MISAPSFFKLKKGKADSLLTKTRLLQTLWAPAIWFVLFLFVLPIYTALSVQSYEILSEYSELSDKIREFSILFGFQNAGVKVLTATFGVFTGWNLFSYLHSTSRVDLYHSLPIARRRFFFSNFLAGNLAFIVPYAINALLALILFAGATRYADLRLFFIAILYHWMFFNLFFLIAILATLLTGTKSTTVLMSLVLLESTQILLLGSHTLAQRLFYTFDYYDWDWHSYTSPITFYISKEGSFWAVIPIMILFFLTMYLFEKRPSELSGQAVWGKIFAQAIKYYTLTAVAIVGGILFEGIGNSVGWMYFGFAFTIFFGHLIIEGIYHFDVKKIFSRPVGLVVFTIVFFAVWISFDKDLWKYDQRHTEPSAVEYYDIEFSNRYNYSRSFLNQSDISVRIASDEGKEAVDRLVQAGIRSAIRQREKLSLEEKYLLDSPYAADSTGTQETYSMRIVIKPSHRNKYVRRYSQIPEADYRDFLNSVYDLQEFKMAVLAAYEYDAKEITEAHIDPSYESDGYSITIQNRTFYEKLLTAFKEDFLSTTAEEIKNAQILAEVQLNIVRDHKDTDSYYNPYVYLTIPVFDCYEQTVEVLQETGKFRHQPITADRVSEVYMYVDTYNELKQNFPKFVEGEEDPVTGYMVMRKKESVEWVLQNFAPVQMIEANPFIKFRYADVITAVLENRHEIEMVYVQK